MGQESAAYRSPGFTKGQLSASNPRECVNFRLVNYRARRSSPTLTGGGWNPEAQVPPRRPLPRTLGRAGRGPAGIVDRPHVCRSFGARRRDHLTDVRPEVSCPRSVAHSVTAAMDDERIWVVDHGGVLAVVVELVEEEAQGVDAGAFLFGGLGGDPWCVVLVGCLGPDTGEIATGSPSGLLFNGSVYLSRCSRALSVASGPKARPIP